MYTRRNMCTKKERNNTCETKVKKNIHHLIYIYIKEYNVCKKWSQGHGTCNEKRIQQNLTTSLKKTQQQLSPYLVLPPSHFFCPV